MFGGGREADGGGAGVGMLDARAPGSPLVSRRGVIVAAGLAATMTEAGPGEGQVLLIRARSNHYSIVASAGRCFAGGGSLLVFVSALMYAHGVFVPWLLGGALWALSSQPPATSAVTPSDDLSIAWEAAGPCSSEEQVRAGIAKSLPVSAGEVALGGALRARLVQVDDEVEPDRWSMELTVTSAAGSWRRRFDEQRCEDMVAVAIFIATIALNPVEASGGMQRLAQSSGPRGRRGAAAGGVGSVEPLVVRDGDSEASAARAAARTEAPSGETSPTAEASAIGEASPAWLRRMEGRTVAGRGEQVEGQALGAPSSGKRPKKGLLGASARVATLGSLGPLPGLAPLLLGGVGLTIDRRALFELAAIHRFQAQSTALIAPGVTLSSRLSGGRMSGCWTPRFAAVELPLCGGFELAALRVEALGLVRSTPSTQLHAAAFAGTRLLWRPSPWVGLGVDVGASVVLWRYSYALDELPGAIVTTGLVGGHGGLSLELRVP